MMKCKCIRYALLNAGIKDEILYVFVDGELVPVDSVFPLEDFETQTGKLVCICPYYNYLDGDRLIPRAFEKYRQHSLSGEDHKIIKEAVLNCKNTVDVKKYLIFNERYKEIIELFCKKNKQRLIVRVLKLFLSFLNVRNEYMDITLCDKVTPGEKKKCFDDLWVEAFERYLDDVGFSIDK